MKPTHDLQLGEPVTAAAWYRTPKDRDFAQEIIDKAYQYDHDVHGALLGPVVYENVHPSDSRCPEPPDRDLMLLVGRAKVVGFRSERVREMASFIDDLDFKDLTRLRKATRQAYKKLNPTKPRLTNEQCDRYIKMVGPEVHYREIKAAVDQGRVG